MKKFYIVTKGTDLHIFTSLTGVNSAPINMLGNYIYYMESDIIDNSQAADQVSIFGTDEFNQLQSTISIESNIDALPISPVDGGWYLIAQDVAYNNIVTITLDGAITGVIVGDNVVAENGVTGVVTNVSGTDLTIKYNGTTAFSQTIGSNMIHEGTTYSDTTVNIQEITDEDKVGPFTSDIVNNPNALVYYDSTANALWKVLKPFDSLSINYDNISYVYNNAATSDKRWKLMSSVTSGNSSLETESDLSAPGSTGVIETELFGGGVIQFTIANIDTDVTMRAEGSNDQVGWFNMNASSVDTTYTSNGTYGMVFSTKYKYIRLTMVSETGGTAVTVEDISFFLTN